MITPHRYQNTDVILRFLQIFALVLLISNTVVGQNTSSHKFQIYPSKENFWIVYKFSNTSNGFTTNVTTVSLDFQSGGNNNNINSPTSPSNNSSNQRTSAIASGEGSKKKFFLSYSRKDMRFAKTLKSELEKKGHIVWMDKDCIEVGENYQTAIDDAIESALAVILVMSPDAKQSEYVTYEWAFAFGSKVKVIPIMFKKTPLLSRLETIQYIDFSNKSYKPWDKLFNTLNNLKTKKAESPQSS